MVMTQGMILNNVRSEKYNSVKCYGVVITSRCDIANQKIDTIHFLIAVLFEDWFKNICIKSEIEKLINEKENNLKKKFDSVGLDFDAMKKIDAIDLENQKEKYSPKIISIIKEFDIYKKLEYSRDNINILTNDDMKSLNIKITNRLIDKVRHLFNCDDNNYCYINSSGNMWNNMVVDLREIRSIPFEMFKIICEYGLDYNSINLSVGSKEIVEKNKVNEIFYFNTKDDFIIADYPIKSPWLEHLLQKFSNAYGRIGVDNPSKDDIEDLRKEMRDRYE